MCGGGAWVSGCAGLSFVGRIKWLNTRSARVRAATNAPLLPASRQTQQAVSAAETPSRRATQRVGWRPRPALRACRRHPQKGFSNCFTSAGMSWFSTPSIVLIISFVSFGKADRSESARMSRKLPRRGGLSGVAEGYGGLEVGFEGGGEQQMREQEAAREGERGERRSPPRPPRSPVPPPTHPPTQRARAHRSTSGKSPGGSWYSRCTTRKWSSRLASSLRAFFSLPVWWWWLEGQRVWWVVIFWVGGWVSRELWDVDCA